MPPVHTEAGCAPAAKPEKMKRASYAALISELYDYVERTLIRLYDQ